MSNANTVRLMDYSNKFKEFDLSAAAIAGMLMEIDSDGKLKPNSSGEDTNAQKIFLFEKELEGKEMNEQLESGEKVQAWYPGPGDEVNAILVDGETVSIGDLLASNGDGKLQATTATAAAVAVAREAMDLSGSSGEESSGALGYDKRIRAEVL